MDEDDAWLRPPWEDADPPPVRHRAAPPRAHEALLIPLARAQDAVARLEASVAAAPEDVATGLRARLALFEAAGSSRIAAWPCIRTTWRCATPISPAPTRSPRSPAGCGKRRHGARQRTAGRAVAVGRSPRGGRARVRPTRAPPGRAGDMAAARRIGELPGSARSRLQAPGTVALARAAGQRRPRWSGRHGSSIRACCAR